MPSFERHCLVNLIVVYIDTLCEGAFVVVFADVNTGVSDRKRYDCVIDMHTFIFKNACSLKLGCTATVNAVSIV
jgi:hypothetical protein